MDKHEWLGKRMEEHINFYCSGNTQVLLLACLKKDLKEVNKYK